MTETALIALLAGISIGAATCSVLGGLGYHATTAAQRAILLGYLGVLVLGGVLVSSGHYKVLMWSAIAGMLMYPGRDLGKFFGPTKNR